MLDALKQLIGIKKKQILLSVPAYFPLWHSRFGEETEFRQRITTGKNPKIHAFKQNARFWDEMLAKYRAGGYRIIVCHMGDDPDRREYYPILHAHRMDIQRACFTHRDDILLIDGKDIPAETIALNEGLEKESRDKGVPHRTFYGFQVLVNVPI